MNSSSTNTSGPGTPSVISSRRGSTKISMRYGSNSNNNNNNNSGTIEELSPELNLIISILKIWIKDLRFLSHLSPLTSSNGTEDKKEEEKLEEERGFGEILIAIVQLLGERNEKLLRNSATDLLLALNRSEVEEVGMARDGVFEIYAYVTYLLISCLLLTMMLIFFCTE